jgi:hypothetical protein
MEKKAIAAVIASRGCSRVWPMERRLKLAKRLRKGMTFEAWSEIPLPDNAGRPSRVFEGTR